VADWLQRDGALYLASGVFDDTPLARAAMAGLEAQPDYWGASISYRITEPPLLLVAEGEIPVYTNGVNNFISIVPKRMAANLFTAAIVTEEVRRMNKQTFDELVRLIGAEAAAQFAGQVDDANRTIEEVGLVMRVDGASTITVAPADSPIITMSNADPNAKTLHDVIREDAVPPTEAPAEKPGVTLEDLATKVADIQAQLDELKASYGMMQEASTRSVDEQKRAVTQLDDVVRRLTEVEASKTRWDQWLDDAPEHMKTTAAITRARDTEPKLLTMAELAAQNTARMNRGPHSSRHQPQP
jgi:hypothetical protein